MPDEKSSHRIDQALKKVLAKIENHQQEDGSWKSAGWAPKLSQSMAVKGLNRAVQNGVNVNESIRKRAESMSRKSYDKKNGSFAPDGSAGVELYAAASTLSEIQDSVTTNKIKRQDVERSLKASTDPQQQSKFKKELAEMDAVSDELASAQEQVVERLQDDQFIAGFGTNGGEEFLSYLNIGESLILKGGEAWEEWDKAITENMTRTQDDDGAWKGKHCITGGTFCTSSALLVLMVDRTPTLPSHHLAKR